MLEPDSKSRHPVGDYLRAAADQVEKTDTPPATFRVDPWTGLVHATHVPWVTLASPDLAGPLAAWLRSAAEDAEQIGADVRAVAVADVILGSTR